MILYHCCTNLGNPVFTLGSLRERQLNEMLLSEKRMELINTPPQQFCQFQCRNHKNNLILSRLMCMSENSVDMLITEKLQKQTPLHFEFYSEINDAEECTR